MIRDYTTWGHGHVHVIRTDFEVSVCRTKSLFERYKFKTQTRAITVRRRASYTRAHICICSERTQTPTRIHTRRGNPGRFISGGLQHSGCLSHFIGHRGRTGIGLFKFNPAGPTHSHTQTRVCVHIPFLFSSSTDASQSQ